MERTRIRHADALGHPCWSLQSVWGCVVCRSRLSLFKCVHSIHRVRKRSEIECENAFWMLLIAFKTQHIVVEIYCQNEDSSDAQRSSCTGLVLMVHSSLRTMLSNTPRLICRIRAMSVARVSCVLGPCSVPGFRLLNFAGGGGVETVGWLANATGASLGWESHKLSGLLAAGDWISSSLAWTILIFDCEPSGRGEIGVLAVLLTCLAFYFPPKRHAFCTTYRIRT